MSFEIFSKMARLEKKVEKKFNELKKETAILGEYMRECSKRYENCTDSDPNLIKLIKAFKSSSGEFDQEIERNKQSTNTEIQHICLLHNAEEKAKEKWLKQSNKIQELRREKIGYYKKRAEEREDVLRTLQKAKQKENNPIKKLDELDEIRCDSSLQSVGFVKSGTGYRIKRKNDRVAIYTEKGDCSIGQVISIDDIMYFLCREEQNIQPVSKIGIAVTEKLWGTAAAVNKANRNVKTNRIATIYFKSELGREPIKINGNQVDDLIAMMPEKLKST